MDKEKKLSKKQKITLVTVLLCFFIGSSMTVYDIRVWACRITKGNFCLSIKGPARVDWDKNSGSQF
jgi:hypothetical protein